MKYSTLQTPRDNSTRFSASGSVISRTNTDPRILLRFFVRISCKFARCSKRKSDPRCCWEPWFKLDFCWWKSLSYLYFRVCMLKSLFSFKCPFIGTVCIFLKIIVCIRMVLHLWALSETPLHNTASGVPETPPMPRYLWELWHCFRQRWHCMTGV